MQTRNSEFQNLNRFEQLERMGVSRRSHQEIIFNLECANKTKEATSLIKAVTNPYLSIDLANRLAMRYYFQMMVAGIVE